MAADIVGGQRRSGDRLDHRGECLAILRIGNTEHGAVPHAGMPHQDILDLGRVDVHATRDDHVAPTVAEEQIAIRVEIADIAVRDQPVALDSRPLLRLVVITKVGHEAASHLDLAYLDTRPFTSAPAPNLKYVY